MYIIQSEQSFDSAHFLAAYDGKCRHIHGHRWRVIIEVQTDQLIESGQLEGMVTDFTDLKYDVKALVDMFDHGLILQEGTMRKETLSCLLEDGFNIITVGFRPTAENFAKYFYNKMEEKGYHVKRATVYETPTNSAIYEKM
ncbi:MAG: 6-carboxytetrahydropterin synthase QueD [Firmicutes bacterium HGW-Firmicutes-7]|nr:MAG: 6-carboxytetrahydropterin synthase QueD [Firmicutes bacterium HGW-Firmicutes-7]